MPKCVVVFFDTNCLKKPGRVVKISIFNQINLNDKKVIK